MQIKGKFICAVLGIFIGDLTGAPLGGLVGFLFGGLLGHFMFDRPKQLAGEREYKTYQRRRGQYLYHVFALCAKLAKADGRVNTAEVALMERIMRHQLRLSDKARAHAIKIWKEAKESPRPFEEYARAFFADFAKERNKVLEMMHLLFEVAAADGTLHPQEELMLQRAAGIFHIGRMQYERIKGRFFQVAAQKWTPSDPFYAILGAEQHEPLDAIKKKYRDLAKQWHPDKLIAAGASPEAVRHAKEKFQQINEAYERILALRKT